MFDSSEYYYTSDSIVNFILKYIPVIYITSFARIFLFANDKLPTFHTVASYKIDKYFKLISHAFL